MDDTTPIMFSELTSREMLKTIFSLRADDFRQ